MNNRIIVILLSIIGLYLPSQAKINIPESLTIQQIEAKYTRVQGLFKGFEFSKSKRIPSECIDLFEVSDSLFKSDWMNDTLFMCITDYKINYYADYNKLIHYECKDVLLHHKNRTFYIEYRKENRSIYTPDSIDRRFCGKKTLLGCSQQIFRNTIFSWDLDSIANMLTYSSGFVIFEQPEGPRPTVTCNMIIIRDREITQWQNIIIDPQLCWYKPYDIINTSELLEYYKKQVIENCLERPNHYAEEGLDIDKVLARKYWRNKSKWSFKNLMNKILKKN